MLISGLRARRVWDSRGRPTIEVEIGNADGSCGRAIAPAGASRGKYESVELRDGGKALAGQGVERAIAAAVDIIAPALIGERADRQAALDQRLIELDGSPQKAKLGGNTLVATSMALAHAAAAAARLPLWRYLAGEATPRLPMPMLQIFGGGAHAARRIDVQDFLVIPLGADRFDRAIEMAAEVYRAAGEIMADRGALRGVCDEGGWWPQFASNEEALATLTLAIERAGFRPGEDVAIAIDVAASQLKAADGYQFSGEGGAMDSLQMAERIANWCRTYPIVSVEDAVAEEDDVGMIAFTKAVPAGVQVVGDDYLATSADRVSGAAARGACNAALIKPNQAGTLTETRAAFDAARSAGWRNIISARSGETEDVTIVHLAAGWRAEQLKVGSLTRSERMAKWNEGIRIQEALGHAAEFAGPSLIAGG